VPLVLLAALPVRLTAQQAVTARLDGRVPPAVAAAVRGLTDSAVARGLPAGPLVDKAIEGAAKGVAPERVLVAVRLVLTQLDVADGAIRGGGIGAPDAETIEAGAFAVAAGLSGSEIRDLVKVSVPPYTPAATLRVAGTLAAMGVPPSATLKLIRETVRSGGATADLQRLPGSVQAQMARGQTPAQAAAGLARATAARGSPPGGPKTGKGSGNPHRP
jgi:hypothetical protein